MEAESMQDLKIAVLVKPSLSVFEISEKDWNKETGTLIRENLDVILNPLDEQAIEMACLFRDHFGGTIHSLTMGVPQAEEILRRYVLARAVDEAILLTDRKFARADTIATANTLYCGIRALEKKLGFKFDLVICGVEAIDGDTGQVSRQVSALLCCENIPYVNEIRFSNGRVSFLNFTGNGTETITAQFPCVVSVLEFIKVQKPSFSRTRWAYLNPDLLAKKGFSDIDADEKMVGGKGSKTNVFQITQIKPERNAQGIVVKDLAQFPAFLSEAYKTKLVKSKIMTKSDYILTGEPFYGRRDFWVYAEHKNGKLHPVSFELLAKARKFADIIGGGSKACAVLTGNGRNFRQFAKELAAYGADIVRIVKHPLLANRFSVPHTKAVLQLLDSLKENPQGFFGGATLWGRVLLPRISKLIRNKETGEQGAGQTADCTDLVMMDLKNKKGEVQKVAVIGQMRTALGGTTGAGIVTKDSDVQMATMRPGVASALPPDYSRVCEIIEFIPELSQADIMLNVVNFQPLKQEGPDLEGAKIVVAGGLGAVGNFTKLQELADVLSKTFGVKTAVGASRAAIEASDEVSDEQKIGQTGKTVRPVVYFAFGISGAIQHLVGMNQSDIIVAVNNNPDEPIFEIADFRIYGDVAEVAGALLENFKKGVN